MTAITRNPLNPNLLQPNKFQLNFSRSPELQYFCQGVSIPGISLSEIPQNTPFVDVYLPGEKAIYDILNVTFLIDEELSAWISIHDWIRAMTFPENFEEYKNLKNLNRNRSTLLKPQYSDATIKILSSSNNPIKEFVFYDVFPTTLSTIILSSTDTPENIMTADVSFRYSYYDIKSVA